MRSPWKCRDEPGFPRPKNRGLQHYCEVGTVTPYSWRTGARPDYKGARSPPGSHLADSVSYRLYTMAPDSHPIDLVRGWPHPSLLPTQQLTASSRTVLADPEIYSVALQYGDDPGYQPLREALAKWVHGHYAVERDPERICISGGASQNIACILSSFTDPNVTRAVWLVAPTYHLVCGIFDDAGFNDRLRAFPENDDGPDVQALEKALRRHDERRPESQVLDFIFPWFNRDISFADNRTDSRERPWSSSKVLPPRRLRRANMCQPIRQNNAYQAP